MTDLKPGGAHPNADQGLTFERATHPLHPHHTGSTT
jgi:hypothetical protein